MVMMMICCHYHPRRLSRCCRSCCLCRCCFATEPASATCVVPDSSLFGVVSCPKSGLVNHIMSGKNWKEQIPDIYTSWFYPLPPPPYTRKETLRNFFTGGGGGVIRLMASSQADLSLQLFLAEWSGWSTCQQISAVGPKSLCSKLSQ